MIRIPARPVLVGGVAAVTTVAAFAGVTLSGASPRAHDGGSTFGASAGAYGSTLSLAGGTVRSGHSAITTLGCTTRAGVTHQNTTDHSQLSQAGTVGATSTQTQTVRPDGGGLESIGLSKVTGLDLFDGKLTANAVDAASTVTGGSSVATAGSTTFDDLEIDGHRIDFQPSPNQSIAVPGVGTVTLNAQDTTSTGGVTEMTVNGLDVSLDKHNLAGLPAGAHLVIGHARAALHDVASHPLRGVAYGTEITNGKTVTSKRSFAQIMPCEGTQHAHPARNVGAGVDVARAIRTGAVTSRAVGQTGPDGASGTTRSSVTDISLLHHLVTADVVTAVAHVAENGRNISTSEHGSRIVGLRVDGHPVDVTSKPNTAIDLPGGLGTLYLNHVTTTPRGLTVHTIDLQLAQPRDGLAKGSDIVVGNAVAAIAH